MPVLPQAPAVDPRSPATKIALVKCADCIDALLQVDACAHRMPLTSPMRRTNWSNHSTARPEDASTSDGDARGGVLLFPPYLERVRGALVADAVVGQDVFRSRQDFGAGEDKILAQVAGEFHRDERVARIPEDLHEVA